jgi:glycosyltransferase involved in cell wall biosynthesis
VSVHHVIVGDVSHGVSRLALELSEGRPRTRVAPPRDPQHARDLRAALPDPRDAPAVHLHVTDGLLGTDPAAALAALTAGRRVAVTLHDVPQRAEGEARWARRTAVYAALAAAADLVVVSSEHERATLAALGIPAHAALPLPIDAHRVRPRPEDEPTVGVLGWVHPGKGLAVLAVAVAATRRPATLVALGGVVPGHEAHVDELRRDADRLGLGLRITGYLGDDELLDAASRVRVPVCPHRHVSASGSIGSWLAAGRRPIVADGAYAREVAARLPGALDVTDDLTRSVAAALDDPGSTVLPADLRAGPDRRAAAAAQDALLQDWARRPAPVV